MEPLNMAPPSQIQGRIHSFESFGTVDGPGIRFVVFFQGCLMRCLYCHNRDTWDLDKGRLVTVDDLMVELLSYKNYIVPHGGVTATGGEPTLQAEFITQWFKACKAEGIHTCLDTNGYPKRLDANIEALLEQTDLVLLDLKDLRNDVHKKLTGVSNEKVLDFARLLQKLNKKTWIRYVVVPGWTDDDATAHALGKFIESMQNIEKVELLAYHSMGAYKWESVGDTYTLNDVQPVAKETLERIEHIIQSYGKSVMYSK